MRLNLQRQLLAPLTSLLMTGFLVSCGNSQPGKQDSAISEAGESDLPGKYHPVDIILVVPANPEPGQAFRIVTVGTENITGASIKISHPSGDILPTNSKTGEEMPFWRIDDFEGCSPGNHKVTLVSERKILGELEFFISSDDITPHSGVTWKTQRGWDSTMEIFYSAWINALFYGCDEKSSWSALHAVTQNKEQNFLFNYLSLNEDDPEAKNTVIMRPDCADNPFFLRAYFAWKLGLPFGYHLCDRGYLGRNPDTGQWITNESETSNPNPVLSFNTFLRKLMDGVHSGTARTALDNDNSDYYPVPLTRDALRPGTVYADPYGHTLTLISWVSQTKDKPGLLLAVDAQPDGTVGIKRFWKGNFLFNTSEVVGEPGFKAFRPIQLTNDSPVLMQNKTLHDSSGFVPFSLQQRKMGSDVFYHTMERLINPEPLDPVTELLNLIEALHEQLRVRVISVANGEAYLTSHPGTIIPMPSGAAGIFQSGGQWENFSTPNRDLRLLIAMDEVTGFPEKVAATPGDFDISKLGTKEHVKEKLQSLLDKKSSELSISYTRTDGSLKELTISEILSRRDAFEMAYNPNDGIEIRWGAPEGSAEGTTCKRKAPAYQLATMRSARKWFIQRQHPPT